MPVNGGPAEAKRIYLHVGSPKTGTTFLQNVLWSQREKAAEQGVLLPLDRFHDHFLASLDVRGLADRPEHPTRAAGIWDEVVRQTAAWRGNVLVSHELLASATAEQAERAIAAFGPDAEVHVVLTARDLVRQIPAEWQEHLKHRYTRTLDRFVDELREDIRGETWFWRVQDFGGVLDRWGRTLPPAQVHVVTVPPADADPGLLWKRFATLLGLDPDAFDTRVSRTNTSLGLEQAELLRRVNLELGDRLPLPGPYPAVVKNLLAHKVLAARPGTRILIDAKTRELAVRRSREICDRLSTMGIDVVGDLDELVPRSTEALSGEWTEKSLAEPSVEAMLEESVAALSSVLVLAGGAQDARRRYEELVRELRAAPLRFALVRASERRPLLRKARRIYRLRHVLGRHHA